MSIKAELASQNETSNLRDAKAISINYTRMESECLFMS